MIPVLRRAHAERTGASIVTIALPNARLEALHASFAHALPSPWTATLTPTVDATTSHRRPRSDKSP